MKSSATVLFVAALILAAGCMVTENARMREPGGGSGVKPIDGTLDTFTVLEGDIAGALHSGLKTTDNAVDSSYHFAAGLATSDPEPDFAGLDKARKAEAKRRTARREVIEKIEKPKIDINAPFLEKDVLDKLGMYIVWSTPLAEESIENIWAQDDIILLITRNHKLLALDLYNGYARWRYDLTRPLDNRPTYRGEFVWASAGSTIHAIDAEMGAPKWKTKTTFPVTSPIFAVDETQYVGSADHALYVLQGPSRFPSWRFGTSGIIVSQPLVNDEMLYVGSEDGRVFCYNSLKREVMWHVKTGGEITGDLIQDDQYVYCGSESFNVYAVAKITGAVAWKFHAQAPVRKGMWLAGPKLVLARAEGYGLYAIDKETGTEKWKLPNGLKPVALGRLLYVLTESNTIKAVDPETGEMVWEQSISPFAHVPANTSTDAITLCSQNAQVFLIQEKNGKSLKPVKPADPQARPIAGRAAADGS
ncbi:MAG TPA: PQQ-binding-like beta-propeller repeat protein [Planctomycetota bacterium]|nr:PQQ-binding-like beta-propeller repeat protein [Planctomycetota bacterium]